MISPGDLKIDINELTSALSTRIAQLEVDLAVTRAQLNKALEMIPDQTEPESRETPSP